MLSPTNGLNSSATGCSFRGIAINEMFKNLAQGIRFYRNKLSTTIMLAIFSLGLYAISLFTQNDTKISQKGKASVGFSINNKIFVCCQ